MPCRTNLSTYLSSVNKSDLCCLNVNSLIFDPTAALADPQQIKPPWFHFELFNTHHFCHDARLYRCFHNASAFTTIIIQVQLSDDLLTSSDFLILAAEKQREGDADYNEYRRRRKFVQKFGQQNFMEHYFPLYEEQGTKHLPGVKILAVEKSLERKGQYTRA
ncbi:hypothetical protein B0H14DRAFT_2591324 [Mycena olivaceomarginata]|nr:hypothetical protein B0H14DRAFT_2591324 [Mycena olivaceomarginata]